jgi:hypothetical protein
MAKLGDRVTFTAPLLHHTETVKDGKIIGGSIYCDDQYEFAAIVGKLYDVIEPEEDMPEGSGKRVQLADIFLLVPGKVGQWVKGIREGTQAGEFKVVK